MRRRIVHIYALSVALFAVNGTWGQTWENWSGQVPSGKYEGYKRLTADVTITETGSITVEANKELTIDLNGYTLTGGNTIYGHVFYNDHGTTLKIEDSSAGQTGVITGGTGDRGGCLKVYGKFYFNGGTIKDCKPRFNDTDQNSNQGNSINALSLGAGGAVYIGTGGYMEMNGGNIVNCSTHTTATQISDGTTTHTNVGFGGAVFIHGCEDQNTYKETTFILNSGTIDGCTAGAGGAVYLYTLPDNNNLGRRAIFNMYGGTIKNCKALYKPAPYTHGGGAVMVDEYGEFNMTGGIIEGCETNGHGSGVHVMGKMNMSGNSIITKCKPVGWVEVEWDNENKKWTGAGSENGDLLDDYLYTGGSLGGGIFIYGEKAHVEMTGGEILDNRSGSGGGVLMYYTSRTDPGTAKGGTFVMNGANAVIKDNKVYGKGIGNGAGVYVGGSTFKFINGIIENNVARRYGGGINTHHEGIIEMNQPGSCIIRNNVAMHGGGISQEVGKCDMTLDNEGILIEGNLAHGIGYSKSSTTGGNENEEGMGNGGGIFAEQGTLTIKKGRIIGNIATGHGGGVVLRTRDKNVTIDAKIEGGTIQSNTAGDGGGIYVNVNDAGSTAKMTIGTTSTYPNVTRNTAQNGGGGLALNNGDITMIQGELTYNNAKNGGGIYVENGEVNITKGNIQNNESTNYGGGLYVYSPTGSNRKNVTFSGDGILTNNRAKHGGGVCANGPLDVKMEATIESNIADNGGGICLLNGASMTFGNGLIRNNFANTVEESITTAYQGTTETLHGVGGGVFMSSNTLLSFSTTGEFGLYNNRAYNAADDIFANGNNTEVKFPAVATMQLRDFDVPTDRLYWVEDYVAQDNEYDEGTYILNQSGTNKRYQTALKEVSDVPFIEIESNEYFESIKKKYLCYSLGYQLIFVNVTKLGLEKYDDATFEIYHEKNTSKAYRKLFISGEGTNVPVVKTVALPEGKWKFKETPWSWKYETTPDIYYGSYGNPGSLITEEFFEINKDNKDILIINKIKEQFKNTEIREYEHRKVNHLRPPKK